MYSLVRRLLFLLPAEGAHRLALFLLSLLDGTPTLCRWLRKSALPPSPSLRLRLAGLELENPIGLAAGLDKEAEAVAGFGAMGFGMVEVGTLTPRPQPGNPPPRLFRLPEHQALINRMGFNNHGAAAAAARIRDTSFRPAPLGANIGKNKDTPLSAAVDDYLSCIDALGPVADYLAVNASSPNTPGLRQLQEPEALERLLRAVRARADAVCPGKPVFLKIAPDLSPEAIDAVVDVAIACRMDGLIATNTTLERPVSDPRCREPGGLSGRPLRDLSTAVVRRAHRRAQGRLPIIGVGGVFCARDALEKILAGASAVQVYTGLVYEGPGLVRRMLRELAALLAAGGFSSVSEAVGAESRAGSLLATAVSEGEGTAAMAARAEAPQR